MLKFIAISIIVMAIGCAIVDKFEEILDGKNKHKEQEQYIDTDMIEILKNYGLINAEQLKR